MSATTAPTPMIPPAQPKRRNKRRMGTKAKERMSRAVAVILLIPFSIFVLLPFFWMVSASLKPENEIYTAQIQWLPSDWQFNHFVEIWQRSDMLIWLKNTVLLAVVITALHVITGSFAAYGFSRIRFPGRDTLFVIYIATIAVPWQAYMIPQYQMMSRIGLSDSLWAIIVLQTFSAFGVFLMKQFYDSIPDSLNEAARIDGLSEYGIYWRIMLPLSVPAIASLVIITFTNTWNDFMGPFLYLRSPEIKTIQVGLQTFVGEHGADNAMIMTGSVISVVPIAIVFAFTQRYFVQGVATSGMKN